MSVRRSWPTPSRRWLTNWSTALVSPRFQRRPRSLFHMAAKPHRSGKELDMTRSAALASACTLLLGFGSQALAQGNPLRDAYFGETHVHTSWSADAWLFGNRMTDPADAYKYFKGETIKHPARLRHQDRYPA